MPVLSPAEAVVSAHDLAVRFAEGAAERDAKRILPHQQITALADSGLLAITVPSALGGADLPAETLAEVLRLLAWGDPNIAQIPHSHFVFVNQLRTEGSPAQQARLLTPLLSGGMIANAQSEFGTADPREFRTTLIADGPGWWRLSPGRHQLRREARGVLRDRQGRART